MKKYVIINKTTKEVFGRFNTKEEASEKLILHIHEENEDLEGNEAGYLTIFDFDVQEKEVKEIESYEEAKEYLGLSDESTICGIGKNHEKILSTLAKLLVIAEAWNKEDGFVPDFSNKKQGKYIPYFEYDRDTARYCCISATWASAGAAFCSRPCFPTRERALDFGKKFEALYNELLMIK